MAAGRILGLVAGLSWMAVGCGFELTATTDGGVIDDTTVPPDDEPTSSAPASCKALLTAEPTSPSGTYQIDPDGVGGAGEISVLCDMVTDGGGWTIVFVAPDENMRSGLNYTTSNQRLMNDAGEVLLTYRDGENAKTGTSAVFALPGPWRATSPLTLPATDQPSTTVKINGGNPIQGILRYGTPSFGSNCASAWEAPTTKFGRLCILGTNAPFFTGFTDDLADTCVDSTQLWNAQLCSAERRFSIAVR